MALTPATQTPPYPDSSCLYMAIELSATKWRLALNAGGQRIREKVADRERLVGEMVAGRKRFGLAEDAKVSAATRRGGMGSGSTDS